MPTKNISATLNSMNKTISKQNGFAVVETILIFIIIGLLGFIGWYVYDTNHKTNATLDSTNKTLNQESVAKKASSSKFLFKELGVQMDQPGSLKGLNYTVDSSYLYLSDDNLMAALKKCSDYKEGDTTSFTAISKVNGQYPSNPDYLTDGNLLKQFPDFYVGFGLPNGNGCSDQTAAENLRSVSINERSSFIEAFKNTATQTH